MFGRLGVIGALALLLSACAPPAVETPLTTPSRAEIRAHEIQLIDPVRRPNAQDAYEGVTVRVTVSETGAVTAAEAVPDEYAEKAGARDIVAEAVANARAATFEPFTRDGVARPARFEVHVPLLGPERPVTRRVPFPSTEGQPVVIRLSRTECFGTCPSYTVEIRGDGTVRFEGGSFVAIGGVHHARISPDVVRGLLEQFREADFFSLENAYLAAVTDSPSFSLSLTIGGRTKTVDDYVGLSAGMPFAVVRLQHAVDRAAGTRRWVTGDATTAASLEAAGYDFTSPAAGDALRWMIRNDAEQAALDFIARGAPLLPADGNQGFVHGSALGGAASTGSARVLQALIRRNGDEARQSADAILKAAAQSHDLPTLELALSLKTFDRRQLGLALVAALRSHSRWTGEGISPTIERLLALNPDIRMADEDGETALHHADSPAMVRRLLAAGADIEARDRYGSTPVMSSYDEDVVLALLTAGANPNVVPEYSKPLREKAWTEGWTRVSARLVQAGS